VKATEIEKNAIFSLHRLTVPVKQRWNALSGKLICDKP
jgi:hypothetical protein